MQTTTPSEITLQPNHDGLRLFLHSKEGQRLLGIIVRDTLRVFRDERRHFFRAIGGYGVNSELLRDQRHFPFRWIELTIQHADGRKEHHRIARDTWLIQGTRWMHFQNACESQVILPLTIIRGEGRSVQPLQVVQPSLFSEVMP